MQDLAIGEVLDFALNAVLEEGRQFELDACRLQQLLLQPHEEGVKKVVSEDLGVSAGPKAKRTIGKVKVQGT